jgi:hypothetical protein
MDARIGDGGGNVGKVRAGFGQRQVLYLEPKRAAVTVGCVLMMLVAGAVVVAAVTYDTEAWPAAWRSDSFEPSDRAIAIAATVAAALVLAFLAGAVVNGSRWRTGRAVERLSNDPSIVAALPDRTVEAPSERALDIAPLHVEFLTPRRFPKIGVRLRRVTADANVIGRRPLRIVFLRLFENQPRMRTFMSSAWREFGYVHLLRSAAAVTRSELKWAKRSGDVAGLFVASDAELRSQLGQHVEAPNRKGRYRFTRIGPTPIRVRDRYGSYPVRAVLCHGTFWKHAVDALLDEMDLVVVDLSGYTERNAGTRYEMQRVIDRVPVECVMFLADQRSRKKFLEHELRAAWASMASGSPNSTREPKQALVAITDQFRTTTQTSQQGGTEQVQVRLVPQRRRTRRVVAAAQDRADRYAAGRSLGAPYRAHG